MDEPDAATPDALAEATADAHAVAPRQVMAPDAGSDNEAQRWESAAQVRRDHPRWVVIWCARKNEFQARPLFRAPPDTVASGATAEELIVQMDQIQRGGGRSKRLVGA